MNISRPSEAEEEDEDDDEESLSQSLFDALEPTRRNTLEFIPLRLSSCTQNSTSPWYRFRVQHNVPNPPCPISAVIHAIDDYPGAKQSGLYLWPAGPALAQFLVDSVLGEGVGTTTTDVEPRIHTFWSTLFGRFITSLHDPSTALHIVELGAGCGLAGIVAHEIFSNVLSSLLKEKETNYNPHFHSTLTFTDHDPNTLIRAQKNLDASREAWRTNHTSSLQEEDGIASSPSSWMQIMNQTQVLFQSLKWGDANAVTIWKNQIQSLQKEEEQEHFHLVLGSDVIYSIHGVRPLFLTATTFLQAFTRTFDPTSPPPVQPSRENIDRGVFILTQSFAYDDETEVEIDSVCKELNVSRYIVWDDLTKSKENHHSCAYYSGVRIQVFFQEISN